MAQGITLNIDADATSANKVFDSLNSRAVSTADSMTKAFSNCGQTLQQSFSAFDLTAISAAGKLLADGIESAFGKVKQVGTEIYKTTEYMQSLEMSIKSIVSADSIKTGKYSSYEEAIQNAEKDTEELFAWFKQLSLVSPYEYTDVVEAFKTNANMGESVDTAKKVTKAILELGSGLGLTTPQMKGFSVALAQTAATGRISAMDLRQFANNGFGMDKILSIFNAIGDKYGIVISDQNDFNDAIKAGTITTDDFFDALAEFADTNYGGAVEAMASTIAGLKASLGDIKTNAINDLFLEASKTISTTLKPYVEYLMELLTSGQFTEWGGKINEWVEGLVEPFQKIGETLESGQFMDGMKEAIEYVTGQTTELYDVVDLLTALGDGDEEFIDTWMERLEAVKNFVNFVQENKDTIIAAFKGIGAAIAVALTVNTVEKFISAILALMNPVTALIALGAALGIAYQRNLGGIQEKVAVVKDYLMSLYTAFQNGGLSGVFDKLKEDIGNISFEGILSKLGELKEQVKEKLSDMFNIDKSVFDNIEGIFTGLVPVIAMIKGTTTISANIILGVMEVGRTISGVIDMISTGVPAIVELLSTSLLEGETLFSVILKGFATATGLVAGVAAAIALVADGFRRLTEMGAIDWGGMFGGLLGVITNTFGQIWEKLLPKFNELGQKLKETFSEISDVLAPIAVVVAGVVGTVVALVVSCITGIIAMIGDVVAFIVDYVTLIVDIVSLPFTILRGLWDMFMGILEGSPERIKAGIDRIIGGFTDIGDDVWDLICDIGNMFSDFVETAWETLTTIFNAVDLGAIWDGFEDGFDRVRQNLETKWKGFKEWCENLFSTENKSASPYERDKATSSSVPDAGDEEQDVATATALFKGALVDLERQSYGQYDLSSLVGISDLRSKEDMWEALEKANIPDGIKNILMSLQDIGMSTGDTRKMFESVESTVGEIDQHTAGTEENTESVESTVGEIDQHTAGTEENTESLNGQTTSSENLIGSSYAHYLDGYTTVLQMETEKLGDEEQAKKALGLMSEEEYQAYIMPETVGGVDTQQYMNTMYTGMNQSLGMKLDSFNDVTVDNAEDAKKWRGSFDSWDDIYKGFTQGRIDAEYVSTELPTVLADMGFSGEDIQNSMNLITDAVVNSESEEQLFDRIVFALTGINSEVSTFKSENKEQLDKIDSTVDDIDSGGSGGSTTTTTTNNTTTQGAAKAAYIDNLNAALDEYQNATTDEEKWQAQSKVSAIVAGTQLADGTYIGNVDDAFAIATQLINEGGNGKTALDLQSRYAGYSQNVGNFTVQANEEWRQRQIEAKNAANGAYDGLDEYGNPIYTTGATTTEEEEGGLDKLFSEATLASMQEFANAGGVALLFQGIEGDKVEMLNSIGSSFSTIADALEKISKLEIDLSTLVPQLDDKVVESWEKFAASAGQIADALTTIKQVFTGEAGESEGGGQGAASGSGGEGSGQTGLMALFQPIDDKTMKSWKEFADYAALIAGNFTTLATLMNPESEEGLQPLMEAFVDYLKDDDGFLPALKEFGDMTQKQVVEKWRNAYQYIKKFDEVMDELVRLWQGSVWETAVGKYMEVTGGAVTVTGDLASKAGSAAGNFSSLATAINAACNALERWISLTGGDEKTPNSVPVSQAAHGGIINGLTIVGERGPELVSASRNLNVFTNNTLMGEIAQAKASLNNMSAVANAMTPSYLSGGGNTYDNSTRNDFSFGNVYGEDYLRDFVKEVFTDEVEKAKFLGRK